MADLIDGRRIALNDAVDAAVFAVEAVEVEKEATEFEATANFVVDGEGEHAKAAEVEDVPAAEMEVGSQER